MHPDPTDPSSEGSAFYQRELRRCPMLTLQEERELVRAWRDHADLGAAHRLAQSHLRLVLRIAAGFRYYRLPMADLISEGNVGLMRAIGHFDPAHGCRLSTYATWWIRAAIRAYVMQSQSLVKIGTTTAQKRLFFNLRRLKGELRVYEDGDLRPEDAGRIAHALAVPEREVMEMNRRLAAADASLNLPNQDDLGSEWQDQLVDVAATPEQRVFDAECAADRRHLLAAALAVLDGRERDILVSRRLLETPLSLDALAARHAITAERVRQIEQKTLRKIARSIKAALAERQAAQALAAQRFCAASAPRGQFVLKPPRLGIAPGPAFQLAQ